MKGKREDGPAGGLAKVVRPGPQVPASNPAGHPRPPSLPRFSWNILDRSGCPDTDSIVEAQMPNRAHEPSLPWRHQLVSGDCLGFPSCGMMVPKRGFKPRSAKSIHTLASACSCQRLRARKSGSS